MKVIPRIQLFAPGQGNLSSVDQVLDLAVLHGFRLGDDRSDRQNVDANFKAVLSVTAPIPIKASGSLGERLSGHEGEIDSAGPSKRTIEGGKSSRSAQKQYAERYYFIASSQCEPTSLLAAMPVRSITSGSFAFGISTNVEPRLCASYTYEPEAQKK